MSMETMKALLERRSVRKYKSEPIREEDLRAVLEAACYAPSAINLQHWHFVAVRSPEHMADLKAIMAKVVTAFRPVLKERFAKHPETVAETENFLASLGGAPVCVLAFFLKDDYPDRDGAMQSVSAAIENLLLAAWDKGLGSCWMSAPPRMGRGASLRARCAPAKGECVAAIPRGYPDQSPRCPARREGRYIIL